MHILIMFQSIATPLVLRTKDTNCIRHLLQSNTMSTIFIPNIRLDDLITFILKLMGSYLTGYISLLLPFDILTFATHFFMH